MGGGKVKVIILTIQDGVPHTHFVETETEMEMRQVIAPIKCVELIYVYGGRAVGKKLDMVKLCSDIYKTYRKMQDPWPWVFMHIQQMLTKEKV
jgi:hypothetical protein